MSPQSPINEKQTPPCYPSHVKESQPEYQESGPYSDYDIHSAHPNEYGHFLPPPIDHVGHKPHPHDPFFYEERQPEKKKGTIAKIALIGAAAIFGGWFMFEMGREIQYQHMSRGTSYHREMTPKHRGHHGVDDSHNLAFNSHGYPHSPSSLPEFGKAVKPCDKHQGKSQGNVHFKKPQNEVERNNGEISDESDGDSDDDSNSDSEDGHKRRPTRRNGPHGIRYKKSDRGQPEVRVKQFLW